ncbi:peptide chain release factor H [Reichenbachiella versicolor]|uniref:peptide chain release factor H n=1 Tax=Reichenbachiella versicolor TaxID=1821036 RepID=UPI000D6E0BCF|nr:peptide chain release factor H [Reichenbachiella versicolor]
MQSINNQIIQITSGRGPAECCWVVAQILKLIIKEASDLNLETTVIHREKGLENGTLQSATIKVSGRDLETFIDSWKGTIQWIGQSHYRKFHKRKNWFVGVNKLEESKGISFNEKDVKYEFTRSGGPGGQHVNKVSTAVRATHIPTRLSVFESNSRSQLQNKKEATVRLKDLLDKQSLDMVKSQAKDGWQNHNELDRGKPTRIFKGTDFMPNHKKQKYKSNRKSDKQDFLRRLEY